MSILWNLPGQKGFTSDILAAFSEPKPAYTTLATFLKILHNKGFVNYKKHGNKLLFTPKVAKDIYANTYLTPAKDAFFAGDTVAMIRYIIEHSELTPEEREAIKAAVK